MARSHIDFGHNLKPMSELGSYKIEPGDPDPRGWSVVSADGSEIGEVEDLVIDTDVMKVRQFVVSSRGESAGTGSGLFLIDAADADIRSGSRQLIARAGHSLPGTQAAGAVSHDTGPTSTARGDRGQKTITRAEEEVRLGKREVERGEAVVGKHVETEHVSQPVTRRREEVVVERRPVEPGMRGDARLGDDEVRVPLKEEEVVVEKRPVVKEELVVGKRTVEDRDTVETDVRREKFDIDKDVRGPVGPDRNRNER